MLAPLLVQDELTTLGFQDQAQRIGGAVAYELYALTVTAPAPRTWYLAHVHLDADLLYPGSAAYWGIVLQRSGTGASASVGGLGASDFTLTLRDDLGTYGSGGGGAKRFSDYFAEVVSGYSEPYDLDTATLTVSIAFAGLSSADVRVVGTYAIRPESVSWASGAPQTLTIGFGEDPKLFPSIPRRRFGDEYPGVPDATRGRAVPWWFGRLNVPLVPADQDGSVWVIGESPTATPVAAIEELWVVRPVHEGSPNAETGAEELVRVALTSPFPSSSSVPPGAADVLLTQAAVRLQLDHRGAFIWQVSVSLRAAVALPLGSLALRIVYDQDGLPGEQLVDAKGQAEVNAATVFTVAPNWQSVGFFFEPHAIFVPPDRGVWVVLTYAKAEGGGEIHMATVAGGFLVKRTTADDAWIPTGRQTWRGPVRETLEGIGFVKRQVMEPYTRSALNFVRFPGYTALTVGVVRQPTAVATVNRAFLRFKIADIPAGVSARLDFSLATVTTPTGNLALIEVVDPGPITIQAWTVAERGVINAQVATPSTGVGRISVDVTDAYQAAKADGLWRFCVKFQYTKEHEAVGPGRWYAIQATGDSGPRLVVTTTLGRSFVYAVHTQTILAEPDYLDPTGTPVAAVRLSLSDTIGAPLGPDVRLAASITGIQDDVEGTYTGTPMAPIVTGPDIIHFLARSASASGLTATQVNAEAFLRARNRLADWFDLAGGITDARPAREHYERIARCCRCIVYPDQAGRVTIHAFGEASP